MRPVVTGLTLVLLVLLGPASAHADSTGVAGYSGMNASTCSPCHTATSGLVIAQLSGPTFVKPGTRVTYTFTLANYTLLTKKAGLDVAASGGTLAVNPTETASKLLSGELVHSAPKVPVPGTGISWKLDWTAPLVPGAYTLYGAGLAGNGDGLVGGDLTGKTSLIVSVGNCATDLDCNDKNICTKDSCLPATKECQNTPLAGCCLSAAECDDKNPCTTDSCNVIHLCTHVAVSGCCTTDAACQDNSSCTLNSCDLSTHKCVFPKIPGCCTSSTQCDDGNKCTQDSCDLLTHTCTHLVQQACCKTDADCADSNPCTTDKCDVPTGQCLNAKTAGCCVGAAECDDQKLCTKDTCSANVCANTPLTGCCQKAADCDDHNPCTKDSCLFSACSHDPVSGCTPPDLGVTPAGDRGAAADGPASAGDGPRDGGPAGGDHPQLLDGRPAGGEPTAGEDGCCRLGHQGSRLGWLPLATLLGLLLLALGLGRRR